MRRRSVIKALAAAHLAGLAAPTWAVSGFAGPMLLFDDFNPLAHPVVQRRVRLACRCDPTNVVIAALLLDKNMRAPTALWGVTGYAVEARDVFRSHGRSMAFVQPMGQRRAHCPAV